MLTRGFVPMRIGIDLGGTKIEGVALDRRRERAPAHADPGAARRLSADARRDRPVSCASSSDQLGDAASVGVGMPGIISPATGLVKNANSTWLNGHPLADDLPRRSIGRCASPTTPTASRCRRRPTARRPAPRVVFGVILGTGTGGGIVVDRRVLDRGQRDRGRMGTQPAPGAARRRAPGPPATAAAAAASRRSCPGPAWRADYAASGGERRQRRGDRGARRGGRAPPRSRASRGTRTGWRARSRASSTCSTPTSSCWAAGCRTSTACTSACPQRWGAVRLLRPRRHAAGPRRARRLERRPRRGVAVGPGQGLGAGI